MILHLSLSISISFEDITLFFIKWHRRSCNLSILLSLPPSLSFFRSRSIKLLLLLQVYSGFKVEQIFNWRGEKKIERERRELQLREREKEKRANAKREREREKERERERSKLYS
jgi:hypothetical protein